MKIAVTAANGQLGSAIINVLINEIGKEKVVGRTHKSPIEMMEAFKRK